MAPGPWDHLAKCPWSRNPHSEPQYCMTFILNFDETDPLELGIRSVKTRQGRKREENPGPEYPTLFFSEKMMFDA